MEFQFSIQCSGAGQGDRGTGGGAGRVRGEAAYTVARPHYIACIQHPVQIVLILILNAPHLN